MVPPTFFWPLWLGCGSGAWNTLSARTVTTPRARVVEEWWVGVLAHYNSLQTSDPVCIGVDYWVAPAWSWSWLKPYSWGTLPAFALVVGWVGDPIKVFGALVSISLVYWIQVDHWWGFAVKNSSCDRMGHSRGRVFCLRSPRYMSVVVLSCSRAARFE